MALQDLTPQLRTRLSRMERAVGWFVLLAAAFLAFGFGYYVYNTAERKGWFLTKAPYFTFVDSATGLRVGDPVKLMGFDAGMITKIDPMPADLFTYNVYVEFVLKDPNFGYIWTEGSKAKVATADLLGKRVLEVTRGTGGYPSYVFHPLRRVTYSEAHNLSNPGDWKLAEEVYDPNGTNLLIQANQPLTSALPHLPTGPEPVLLMDLRETRKSMTGIWNDQEGRYDPFTKTTKPYWLINEESPAVTERLEQLVDQVHKALPGVFNLTNQLAEVLSNSAALSSNLNQVALVARPAVSNLAAVTRQLDHPGALGEWLLPTNINTRLASTLESADTTMLTAKTTLEIANTNLATLARDLERSLDNLAGITSNLNAQVEVNTNILSSISEAVVHADQFIQGLKRHWLFRSAFRAKNPPKAASPSPAPQPLRAPKERQQ
jgi:ABC-type transporter Mla subunit MlaD